MNNTNELVTKKYLAESLHDFGQTLMKIFVTKEEFYSESGLLRQEMEKMRQENRSMNDAVLKSNDRIIKMLIEAEAERAATIHRMDRMEAEYLSNKI